MSGSSDAAAYSRTSSTDSTVGSTHANAGLARMPAIAACPIVRPVSAAHRNASVSAFSKLSSMLSRLRCARWSPGGNTVSSVILPESVSDACGTREISDTSPLLHARPLPRT